MNLHLNQNHFIYLLTLVAESLGLDDIDIVEKDYFLTLFLKNMSKVQPGIIFKGGTSLSKCYKVIRRFSEDIDLSVETESAKLTEGQRKRLKRDILAIIEKLGFTLTNPEQVRSRREFNRYVIDFPSSAPYLVVKQHLIVETAVYIKNFPANDMEVSSYIYDFLLENGAKEEIEKYSLEPFPMKVLALERTFIDKVFALGDYYLARTVNGHSRHIYDLYMLYPHIIFDEKFKELVEEVRKLRRSHTTCLSAQEGIDIPELLQKVIFDGFYKADYKHITQPLLFEKVGYVEAIGVLSKIIETGCFSTMKDGER